MAPQHWGGKACAIVRKQTILYWKRKERSPLYLNSFLLRSVKYLTFLPLNRNLKQGLFHTAYKNVIQAQPRGKRLPKVSWSHIKICPELYRWAFQWFPDMIIHWWSTVCLFHLLTNWKFIIPHKTSHHHPQTDTWRRNAPTDPDEGIVRVSSISH